MAKRYWCLINESGVTMKDKLGKVRLWENLEHAMMVIDSEYRSSPYLRPVIFQPKKKYNQL